MKRFFSELAVAIAMMIAVLECHADPRELKIAVIAPLSGYFVGWGNLVRDGAQLAIDEWNTKGGILGMSIVLVKEDSKGNPIDAADVAKAAITTEGIRYFVGDVFSSLSIPISDVTNAFKAILITPTSTNIAVTVDQSGATKPYVFRACFSDPFQGSAGASFAVKTLKAQKAYIMFNPHDAYANGLAQAFVDAFTKLGGAIVGRSIYSNNDLDFSKTLAAIGDAMPDIVYLPASYVPLINMVTKQAKEKGIMATFIGGDFWDSPDLDLRAIDGSYFTSHYWPADPRPEVQAFKIAYNQKYGASGTPDIVAGLSYDATNILLQGIQDAGLDDVAKVAAALEGISFSGVGGKISFDAKHNAVKDAAIVHILGGREVFYSSIAP